METQLELLSEDLQAMVEKSACGENRLPGKGAL